MHTDASPSVLDVWVTAVGEAAGAMQKEVVRALGAEGLRPVRHEPTSSGPGIVVFDRLSTEVCGFIRRYSEGGRSYVIAIPAPSAELTDEGLWRLLDAGASDAFVWDAGRPAAVTARLLRLRTVDKLIAAPEVRETLVGDSPAWRAVVRELVEIASFTDSHVLVTGETGTGKELVARLVHELDPRPDKGDLVVLDCTTVVPTLSGSEFFGHERGAFTGADSTRDGAFALADGGTLFLDEVGELPLPLQAELLRVVQEGTYKRVGGNAWRRTTFRLVCATNRELLSEAAEGRFRHDFYYRIAAWRIDLPSLRERCEDIVPLTRHFLGKLRPEEEGPALDGPVTSFLVRRDYPGNVRDLRQLVARMHARHVGPGPITLGDIPVEERERSEADWRENGFEQAIRAALAQGTSLKEISAAAAETAIRVAIGQEDGNLQRASRRLGITARALQLRRASERENGSALAR